MEQFLSWHAFTSSLWLVTLRHLAGLWERSELAMTPPVYPSNVDMFRQKRHVWTTTTTTTATGTTKKQHGVMVFLLVVVSRGLSGLIVVFFDRGFFPGLTAHFIMFGLWLTVCPKTVVMCCLGGQWFLEGGQATNRTPAQVKPNRTQPQRQMGPCFIICDWVCPKI